jgi:glycosyltransferase involved in cell wall biosynthesis
MKRRLAIVISHPIQHFCPLFAEWAKSPQWDICVFFGSRIGALPYFDQNFGEVVAWRGLSLDNFPHHFLNGDSTPLSDFRLDSSRLEEQLEAFRADAVLTFGYSQRLQRRAQRWARRKKKVLLYFSDSELRQRRSAWKDVTKGIVVRRLLKGVDWFITTGNANEEYYRHYGVPSHSMIRGSHPIDRSTYQTAYKCRAELRAETRHRLGIGDTELVVSMVGKLVPWKRQHDLVRAIGDVQHKRAVALVIGAGEMYHTLERSANSLESNRAILTGFTPSEELPALYAASDLYVHTSEVEPHSVAISEAIYMGLPIVLSDRCGSYGTDDDVRIGLNGLVYRCGDVEQLASTISWFARNPDAIAQMGEKSHEIACKQQDTIYDEVLSTLALLFEAVP